MKLKRTLKKEFREEARHFYKIGNLAISNGESGVMDFQDALHVLLLITERQKKIYEECLERGISKDELIAIDDEERRLANVQEATR